MDQVMTFDKSLQQRLQEYRDVLSGYEILPVSGLMKEWGYYLELTLDPSGWQALWKIPRLTCETLNIPFPSLVLVFVLNLDLTNLQAVVRVIAVQDEIHIPDKHAVPLIQLWPTKDQDRSIALNLQSTANALDMLRFFYVHLCLPWDHEDDDTTDWRSKHLESRLRLYYDMKNGTVPRTTTEHLTSLLTEARRLQSKRENIEIDLSEENEYEDEISNKTVETLMDIHLRLLEIKGEVEILENPLLRKALLHRQEICAPKLVQDRETIWLISERGSVDNHIEFLERTKLLYPNEDVILSSNLAYCLENGSAKDIYLLNQFQYSLKTVGALECGGTLKGIYGIEKTILYSASEDVMLDFQGNVIIDNVTIDASSARCGVVIRAGRVVFMNCRIIGEGKLSTNQGIIVLAGSEVEFVNCEIRGFCTAIVGNSGSKITLNNTEIHDVNFGLKMYDNCSLSATKSTFHDCKDYGICVETENNLDGDEHKVGDFDVLRIVPDVTTEFVSGSNNLKGDVLINHASKIKAVEDLFKEHDPTVSEEEMQTDDEIKDADSTIVEDERLTNISPATV